MTSYIWCTNKYNDREDEDAILIPSWTNCMPLYPFPYCRAQCVVGHEHLVLQRHIREGRCAGFGNPLRDGRALISIPDAESRVGYFSYMG